MNIFFVAKQLQLEVHTFTKVVESSFYEVKNKFHSIFNIFFNYEHLHDTKVYKTLFLMLMFCDDFQLTLRFILAHLSFPVFKATPGFGRYRKSSFYQVNNSYI